MHYALTYAAEEAAHAVHIMYIQQHLHKKAPSLPGSFTS